MQRRRGEQIRPAPKFIPNFARTINIGSYSVSGGHAYLHYQLTCRLGRTERTNITGKETAMRQPRMRWCVSQLSLSNI